MTSDRDTPNGSYCRPADWQLVEACIAGTPGGWDLFIRRFGRLISEVVSRTATRRQRGLSNTDHDDLVAEVFAELLARDAAALKMFSGRSTLTTYLTVIARRVTVRQLQRQLRLIVPAAEDDAAGDAPDKKPSATEAAAQQEEIDHWLACLEKIDQVLVRMHDLEGHNYSEIARATGIPIGSIGPRLSRARATIRQTRDEHDRRDDAAPSA